MQKYGTKDHGKDLRYETISGKLEHSFERPNPSDEGREHIECTRTQNHPMNGAISPVAVSAAVASKR